MTGTSSAAMVLTFDDGPDPDMTPRVLDMLARHGATATFFVLLTRVRRHPTVLADVLAAGHEVALHGPDHRRLTRLSSREVRRRTADARAELEDRTGGAVRWFRPPYGAQTPFTWAAVRRTGLTPVLWSATTWDWNPAVTDDERLAQAWSGSRAGAVMLAHDGVAGPEDGADDGPAPAVDRAALAGRVVSRLAESGVPTRSLVDALVDGGQVVRSAEFQWI